MNKFFTYLYDFMRRHRLLLWGLLTLTVVVMGWLASQLSYNEDIVSFMPKDQQGQKTAAVFNSLRIKDKIVVMLTAPQQDDPEAPDRMIEAAEALAEGLQPAVDEGLLRSVTARVDAGLLDAATALVYNHLPVFLTEQEFARLDSLTRPEAIDSAVHRVYGTLISPAGFAVKDVLLRDPLGLGTPLLASFQQFNQSGDYEIYDDHIYTADLQSLLLFADPAHGSSASAANERLIEILEEQLSRIGAAYDLQADYFGAIGVAVYNARQIKQDTAWTLSIALVVIVLVITLAFRNRWAIPLMILPVIYGALFALALIYLIQGSISTIAIGAGAAVMGIALSYSIHVLAHSNHIHDPRQVVAELAYPLTVGSFTTIGAFLGLLFTRSQLLHDFGLFAALTLIGTTLFSLIFLPHMLPTGASKAPSPLLRRIERLNAYRYDTNKWLLGGLVVVTVVALFFFNDVKFDSDMTRLGYEPQRFKQMEQRLETLMGDTSRYVYLITSADDVDQACQSYSKVRSLLDSLAAEGVVKAPVSAADFVVPMAVQQQRLEQWNRFWTPEKRQQVCERLQQAALRNGLTSDAFAPFNRWLEQQFTPFDVTTAGVANNPVLGDWLEQSDHGPLFVSRLAVDNHLKEQAYTRLEQLPDVTILDRAYYSNRMADLVNDDFNTVLLISSLLVFLALLISYGRIELALLASLPMAVSWVLILGMMALFGIEFNIVNIILSTFIFGLGDDFSIFIMDGLLNEYKNGRKLLAAHKTAIFFSAFTTVVGIGVLVFAGHPALKSVSVISMLGMVAVVLVAYTVQPVLFRLFISRQTARDGLPYTLMGALKTIYAFLYFLFGCLVLQFCIVLLHLLPIGRRRRKAWFHWMMYALAKVFLATIFTVRTFRRNPAGERFEKPAIVVANHQSFVDILLMLSISPKFVMVTNSWVWHSPFFGWIIRYAGCHSTMNGYDQLEDELKQEVAEGYSIVVFPEGTRTADCSIHRFHKGAFQLADHLNLDIVPVLIYGTGYISSKKQPFYIKRGRIVGVVLPRIVANDSQYGKDVRERAKTIRRYMIDEYEKLQAENRDNPYFMQAVVKNYLYKGPVLEWYIRIKLRLEHRYDELDRLLPRQGTIVDVGCGYGQMAFLLALRAEGRQLLGIDYDEEKIALTTHSFLCNDRTRFVCADVTTFDLPMADAFVINDMLHYVTPEEQERIIARCADRLVSGGLIVVREGDRSCRQRHRLTEETERWSTRILHFNKTTGALHFPTSEWMKTMAERYGLSLEIRDTSRHSSNMRYIFRKGGEV